MHKTVQCTGQEGKTCCWTTAQLDFSKLSRGGVVLKRTRADRLSGWAACDGVPYAIWREESETVACARRLMQMQMANTAHVEMTMHVLPFSPSQSMRCDVLVYCTRIVQS